MSAVDDMRESGKWSAFGGLVTTPPFTLLDAIPTYGIDPDVFGTETATGGTVTGEPDTASIALTVTGASGSRACLRTHESFRYQAGKGGNVKTSNWSTEDVPAGQVRRWGYFDDNDGLFFEARSTGIRCVVRSSTSGSVVERAQDIHVPVTQDRGTIYEISFQWLGVGDVDFLVNGLGVSRFLHASRFPAPYMKTAMLPMCHEVENESASSAGTLNVICNHVASEGGQAPPQSTYAADQPSAVALSGTPKPILTIAPSTLYKGEHNRALIYPSRLFASVQGSGSQRAKVTLILNATLNASTWTAADVNSAVEYNTDATTISGGTLIREWITSSSEESIEARLIDIFAITRRSLKNLAFGAGRDTLTIQAEALSGSPDIAASLGWGEVR